MEEQMAAYTRRLENTFSYQWVFIASDSSKAYYANTGLYQILDPDSEEDSWYQEFVDQNKEYVVTIGTDNDVGVATVFVDVRIENEDGDFLGVCGVAMQLDRLQNLIVEYEDEYGIEVQFVDEDKEVQIACGNVDEDVQIENLELNPEKTEQILVDSLGLERDYTIVKYIEQLDWYMIIRDYNPFAHTVDLFLILFTAFSSILVILITVLCLRYILKRNQMLYASSYRDEMTGLYNRRAYEDKRKELRKYDSMKKYSVIVFDVNGLKSANDTLGHFAGDELIRGASRLIREVFEPQGQCFRTGGDEFVVFVEAEEADIRCLTRRFDELVSEWEGEYVKKLSVSYGAVCGSKNPEWTVDELTTLADEKMYWQKKKYYKKAGRDRRRA
jgi:diguanylate cyclase (GGDEF)-like protein